MKQAGWARVPAWAWLVALAACLFAIRILGPPNILDQDQERPASYVLDATRDGNWICQKDWAGDISSKPPLFTWLCALVTVAAGRIGVFSLYLPGALAALGSGLLMFYVGRKPFGTRAAFIGAVACLLSPAAIKQFGLARTDGVFAFTVALTAVLAFRSWNTGKGWAWFWLAAAASTLTKGPVGLLLGAFGLLAVPWERRTAEPMPLRGSHWVGVGLCALVVGGWFSLAYWYYGEALIAKMIGQELVGHAVSSTTTRHLPGTLIYQQPLYYLGRSAPWSLLAYFGLWKIWRRPSVDSSERRLERFLFCWFGAGLLLFSLAPHQRADLLWPLLPAGALIAGRELDLLGRRFSNKKFNLLFGVAIGFGLLGAIAYNDILKWRDPWMRQTVALKQMAQTIEQRGGAEFPLTHVDEPMTLQVYLNTVRPPVSLERALALLRGSEAAFVAVAQPKVLEDLRQPGDPILHTLLAAPEIIRKKSAALISNRPELAAGDHFAFCYGPWLVRSHCAELLEANERHFRFTASQPGSSVEVENQSNAPATVTLCVMKEGREVIARQSLSPGKVLRCQP